MTDPSGPSGPSGGSERRSLATGERRSFRARLGTFMALGRVSNLPTVWTNVLTGYVLNGGTPTIARILPFALAGSLLYLAGMFLNDAYDHRWDRRHRPERPIPAGQITVNAVFTAGFGLMLAGLLLLAAAAPTSAPLFAGLVLSLLIVLYDVHHKGNRLAPLLMALCRVGLYVMAALAAAPRLSVALTIGALLLLGYLILLSSIARQESKRPGLAPIVAALIAGISLLDGALLLARGERAAALFAVVAFVITRLLQRRIAAT